MVKQINERKDTSELNIMKSELIMKNNNRKITKNKIKYLEGKLFKVHGLYF